MKNLLLTVLAFSAIILESRTHITVSTDTASTVHNVLDSIAPGAHFVFIIDGDVGFSLKEKPSEQKEDNGATAQSMQQTKISKTWNREKSKLNDSAIQKSWRRKTKKPTTCNSNAIQFSGIRIN